MCTVRLSLESRAIYLTDPRPAIQNLHEEEPGKASCIEEYRQARMDFDAQVALGEEARGRQQ